MRTREAHLRSIEDFLMVCADSNLPAPITDAYGWGDFFRNGTGKPTVLFVSDPQAAPHPLFPVFLDAIRGLDDYTYPHPAAAMGEVDALFAYWLKGTCWDMLKHGNKFPRMFLTGIFKNPHIDFFFGDKPACDHAHLWSSSTSIYTRRQIEKMWTTPSREQIRYELDYYHKRLATSAPIRDLESILDRTRNEYKKMIVGKLNDGCRN